MKRRAIEKPAVQRNLDRVNRKGKCPRLTSIGVICDSDSNAIDKLQHSVKLRGKTFHSSQRDSLSESIRFNRDSHSNEAENSGRPVNYSTPRLRAPLNL
jgi:hypothetical protein